MNESDLSEEIRASLDNIKAWLAGRSDPEGEEAINLSAPEGLRSIGFADLKLEKYDLVHQDGIVFSYDNATQKPTGWTELSHLIAWSTEFSNTLRRNKSTLAVLELIRGANDIPIGLAKFHVDEAFAAVYSATNFDHGLDVQHPDTKDNKYAATSILIEDSTSLKDIVLQVFTCLYSKCLVRLVVKSNHFYSASLTAYLVDLMYKSGATSSEVKCIAFNPRESLGNERFTKCLASNRSSKLSNIATVFKQTDTFAAAQGIIESYFRDQYPNMIILVEESAYERFVKDWQRYYSHAIHIGSRLDNRTTVVDSFNSKVKIDLAAIDIKSAHKMSGDVINILKFRTLSELISLLGNLRKVPHMSIWNDDILLAREFCLRLNLCSDFWINHIPKSMAERRFPEEIMNYFSETVSEDMTVIYNFVSTNFDEDIEQLRKIQATFIKKDTRLRSCLIIQALTSLITKSKSLRNGYTVGEAVARLKRFQFNNSQRFTVLELGDSRIETISKPAGLAIIHIRDDTPIKSKGLLIEFIFRNLIIGNAVLLVCPPNTLGAKFGFDNDHVIPFKMVHESTLDMSKLTLEDPVETSTHETSVSKRQCPKNSYAVEILPEMSSENYETLIAALGCRRKCIWYSNLDQSNYWSE